MKTRQVLVRAAQAVAFLFAAFSGFLKRMAPPEEAATGFSVGTACLLTLCVFLLLSTWVKKKSKPRDRTLWFTLAGSLTVIAAFSAVSYKYNLDRLTFGYPPENPQSWYIGGTQYTAEASALTDKRNLSPSEIVARFGGLPYRHWVWPPASTERAKLILVTNYLIFALSIAGAVFSLVEMQTSTESSRH